jgi:hypothetical protein
MGMVSESLAMISAESAMSPRLMHGCLGAGGDDIDSELGCFVTVAAHL